MRCKRTHLEMAIQSLQIYKNYPYNHKSKMIRGTRFTQVPTDRERERGDFSIFCGITDTYPNSLFKALTMR